MECHATRRKHAFPGRHHCRILPYRGGRSSDDGANGADQQQSISCSGEDANPVPFDIHLQECSTAVSQRVGVAFHGVADGKNPDVLSVGEGPGIATGIGIALFDQEGSQLPLNLPPVSGSRLYSGPTTLHFVAKYRSTGRQVTGGAANAQAWFSLTYQ